MNVTVEHYLADLHRKPHKRGEPAGVGQLAIARRKFIFLRDGDDLVIAIGPPFRNLADYSHDELRKRVMVSRGRILRGPFGGGVVVVGANDIMFQFWSRRLTGDWDKELDAEEVWTEAARQLGRPVHDDRSHLLTSPF